MRSARPLTPGEADLAHSIFGGALSVASVRIIRGRWWPLQPSGVIMAPTGNIHVHPKSDFWRDDYAAAPLPLQALLLHELTHVWQSQRRGRFYLPLMRHPFCRYRYDFAPGRPFERYGLEQQAEIVRHAFLLSRGAQVPGKPGLPAYRALLPFGPA
jgi:hypothetical protein